MCDKSKKIIVRRRLIWKGSEKDLGLGKGVLYRDELIFDPADNKDFSDFMLARTIVKYNDELIQKYIDVDFDVVNSDDNVEADSPKMNKVVL